MNTPQSMMIGWGSLIAAAGVAYYYAKQDINLRRKEQREAGVRPTEKKEWYDRIDTSTPVTPRVTISKGGPPAAQNDHPPPPDKA